MDLALLDNMFTLRVALFCTGFICVSSAKVAVEGSSCNIPDGRVGKCLRWDRCPLTNEIMRRIPLIKEELLYIKTLNCGYRGYQPYHCCIEGMVPETIKPVPETIKPVPETNRPVPETIKPEVPASPTLDIYKETEKNALESHPNSHLLPLGSCGIKPESYIRGGTVADLGDFPWLALIHYTNKSGSESHFCGGALINSRYVLTAAHCLYSQHLKGFEPDMVRLGEYDLTRNPDSRRAKNGQWIIADPVKDIEIEETIIYEGYTAKISGLSHDIGLIRLKQNVPETRYVRTICLPSPDVEKSILEGVKLEIAGWGNTEYRGNPSKLKQKAEVPLVDRPTCARAYKNITETQLCAGKEGTDACQGDSGGPLMGLGKYRNLPNFRHFVVGVVSFGFGCGNYGYPGVYARVLPYIGWILDHMRP